MRNAVIAASVAPVDNQRGRGRKRDNNILDTNVQPAGAAGDAAELALLTKTLEHLSDKAIEKEEKAQHSLRVHLVRDKLVGCKRRSEVFLQRLNLSSKMKKKPDTMLLEKLEANEEEIERLEGALVTMHEEECRRHSDMIIEKKRRAMSGGGAMTGIATPMIGTSGSFESTSGIESSSGNDSGGNNSNENGKETSNRDIVVVNGTPASTPNITTCYNNYTN